MKEFTLEPGEVVIRQTRKHWFFFLLELLPYPFFALAPLAVPPLLRLAPQLAPYASQFSLASPLARAGIGLWLLLSWTAAWGVFTRYFLNLWVLTNQRIVEIKQRSFFDRTVSSVLLNRVQDVTTSVRGPLVSLLGIGTIRVQSAGTEEEFCMRGIPDPEVMRDLILRYVTAREGSAGTTGV